MPITLRSSRRGGAGRSLLAAGAALLLTSACFGWGQRGYDAGKTSNNPNETALSADTVAGLAPVWSVDGAVARTVSSGNRVHVLRGTEAGTEVATYSTATGADLWAAPVSGSTTGYLAVLGDRVVASTVYWYEYCYHFGDCVTIVQTAHSGHDVTTGADEPHPLATTHPSFVIMGEAAVGAHVALTPGYLSESPYGSLLQATYDGEEPDRWVGSGAQLHPILDEKAAVAFTTPAPAGTQTPPEVIDAWPLTCEGLCEPLWTHPGSTERSAFEASTTTLYVVGEQLEAVDTATGTLEWSAPVAGELRPAVRNGTVYAISDGRLVAVPSCSTPTCAPAWSSSNLAGTITPVIGGDVVYVASSNAGGTTTTIHAYDADGCGAARCDPLATVTAIGSPEDMLVAGGRLVVQTSSGVFAFGLPA